MKNYEKFIWVCLSLLCCFTLFESFSGTFVYVFFPFVFSRSQSSRINMDLDDRGLLKGALRQRTIRKKLQRAPNSKIQSSVRFKVYSFTHHLEGYFRVIFYTEYLHYSTIPSEDFHWFAVRQDESRGGRCAKDFWRIPRFCGCRSTHLFGHSGGAWIFCHFSILWLPNVYCKWSMQTWKKKGRLLPLFFKFFPFEVLGKSVKPEFLLGPLDTLFRLVATSTIPSESLTPEAGLQRSSYLSLHHQIALKSVVPWIKAEKADAKRNDLVVWCRGMWELFSSLSDRCRRRNFCFWQQKSVWKVFTIPKKRRIIRF